MADSLNIRKENSKKTKIEARVLNKSIVKRYRRGARNARRRYRRKKSKKAYINMLKKERITRETEELCSSIQEVNVVDMEELPLSSLPEEISEWQRQDQIAYWKSRAISFEIENKTLREHLRNLYAEQILHDYNQSQALPSGSLTTQQPQQHEKKGKVALKEICQEKVKVLPKEPTGKNRLKEMEKIYGDVAPKIMGMETAIELNYQRLVEEAAPAYWPNIPLNL